MSSILMNNKVQMSSTIFSQYVELPFVRAVFKYLTESPSNNKYILYNKFFVYVCQIIGYYHHIEHTCDIATKNKNT